MLRNMSVFSGSHQTFHLSSTDCLLICLFVCLRLSIFLEFISAQSFSVEHFLVNSTCFHAQSERSLTAAETFKQNWKNRDLLVTFDQVKIWLSDWQSRLTCRQVKMAAQVSAVLLLLCGWLVRGLSAGSGSDSALGRMELLRVRSLAAQPRYGECWARALEHLDTGCRDLTSESQSRIALRFTLCHLSR